MTSSTLALSSRALLIEGLRQVPSLDAAALYGSAARGDMEAHSDIDLLLLCSPGRKRAVIEALDTSLCGQFPRLSLSTYSADELTFLNKMHSLFVLHLKREAEVLFDHQGFLGMLLGNFREKDSYATDFAEALPLLDPLLTQVARSPNQLHRLSYAYSLFRVFGVYLLAEKRIFEFSKSKMAVCLSREYPQAQKAIARLSDLRVLNSNFFSGTTYTALSNWGDSCHSVQGYVSALCELAPVDAHVIERSYAEAVTKFHAAAVEHRRLNYRLRMWFLLLIYDGLNLYRQNVGLLPFVSFDTGSLEHMISGPLPPAVISAAAQALDCIRDYRSKYFLNHEAKMSTASAIHALSDLAEEV